MVVKLCQYCGNELNDNQSYFCNADCENKFRDENQELYIMYNNGEKDSICPVVVFTETDNEIICDNGYYEYRINKSDIEKWKIDKCNCLIEHTNIIINFN